MTSDQTGPPPLRRVAPPKATPDPLPRIEALTRNARNTWFVLLSVLVFVTITLMGVEHIDFWGVGRATELPLVGVAVPTWLFFYAAPILTAAVYCYFHLYLLRVWDAIFDAEQEPGETPLGDRVAPWLVIDAVLYWRNQARGDGSATPRAMDWGATVLNFILIWAFGIGVLYATWRLSTPARDPLMTFTALGMGLIALAVGLTSLAEAIRKVGPIRPATEESDRIAMGVLVIVAGVFGAAATWQWTMGPTRGLADLSLVGEPVVERPDGWLPRAYAEREFRAKWCVQEGIANCADLGERKDDFDREWEDRRAGEIAALVKPFRRDWVRVIDAEAAVAETGADDPFRKMDHDERQRLAAEALAAFRSQAPDLRAADLRDAFLSGLDMTGANLSQARMERARLEGARLFGALLPDAILHDAQLQRADLRWTQMEGANLSRAQMQGADLSFAQMEGADLSFAQMEGADLRGAQMEGANLSRAQMQGADLSRALLTGTVENPTLLQSANLIAGTNNGGAIRFADLTQVEFDPRTDFRNAFLDGSVQVTGAFRAQMGSPCQWTGETLSDAEFYGRWRWWIEQDPVGFPWEFIAPEDWREVPVNDPGTDCVWKTGPMPGAESTDP